MCYLALSRVILKPAMRNGGACCYQTLPVWAKASFPVGEAMDAPAGVDDHHGEAAVSRPLPVARPPLRTLALENDAHDSLIPAHYRASRRMLCGARDLSLKFPVLSKKFPVRRKKFPVPFRREFCCKPLKLPRDSEPKSRKKAENPKNSLGICLETGCIGLRPQRRPESRKSPEFPCKFPALG